MGLWVELSLRASNLCNEEHKRTAACTPNQTLLRTYLDPLEGLDEAVSLLALSLIQVIYGGRNVSW